jgi:MtN3 and saliva related transmembrane protein
MRATLAASDRSAAMALSLPDIVGTAAALCSMASFTPQIVKIWREKDASSISLRMYVVTVSGFGLWIVYGVLSDSWPVIGANSVCLMLSAAILGLKWRYRDR